MAEVEIVEVKPQLVCGIRKQGPYSSIKDLLMMLYGHLGEKGAEFAGAPMYICHETSSEEAKKADAEGNADVEVVAPVTAEVEGTEEITCYEVPGGTMAKIVHTGPYEKCEPTYAQLYKWLEENGKHISGPTREVYLNSPEEVSEEELLTEIYAPIA
ncbi:GyrI-like domain-containing protein [Patescibacteria group bacterium]|nr:GyrI-like domain-containing protein [Patescibacteria group bacterium]